MKKLLSLFLCLSLTPVHAGVFFGTMGAVEKRLDDLDDKVTKAAQRNNGTERDGDPQQNNPTGDSDGDGVADYLDNCPNHYNPTQQDSDNDNIGDYCDDQQTLIDYDNAIVFDGTNHIEKDLIRNIRVRNDFPKTISAWAKAESVSNKSTVAWYGRKDSDGQFLSLGFLNDNGLLKIVMNTRAGGEWVTETSSNINIETGVYYHLAAVWESEASRKLYINGEPAAQFNSPSAGPMNAGGQFSQFNISAGRDNDQTPENNFYGALADVEFWDFALSEDDIRFAYENPNDYLFNRPGSGATSADVIAIWQMTDKSGSIVSDFTNRRNVGIHYRNGNEAEIQFIEDQYHFSGRVELPNYGKIEDFLHNSGNPGEDWEAAWIKAQWALDIVDINLDITINGPIKLPPHTTFTSTLNTGIIRMGDVPGMHRRLFLYNGVCGQNQWWHAESIRFENLTIDYNLKNEYGGWIAYSSPFNVCGGGNSNNLSWDNLNFIESVGTPHGGASGGDIWGINFGPEKGVGNSENLHTGAVISNNYHAAKEQQFFAGQPDESIIDGMIVENNTVIYGRSIGIGISAVKDGGESTIRNSIVKNNTITAPWKHGFEFGLDGSWPEPRRVTIQNLIVENNRVEFPADDTVHTGPGRGFGIKLGDEASSIHEGIVFRNNQVINSGSRLVKGLSIGQNNYFGPESDIRVENCEGPVLSMGRTNMNGIILVNNNFEKWRPRPEAHVLNTTPGVEVAKVDSPIVITDNFDITIFFQPFDISSPQYLSWGDDENDFIRINSDSSIHLSIDGTVRTMVGQCCGPEEFKGYELRLVGQGEANEITAYLNDEEKNTVSFWPIVPPFSIASFGGALTGIINEFTGRIHDINISNQAGYSGVGTQWEDTVGNNNVTVVIVQ